MTPQELFNNWARMRAEKHFNEGEKQNEYPWQTDEHKVYNDRWAELEKQKELDNE